ncbi:hypothetical protein J7F03_17655 [Streptomyces sp. ISL-43]|uniref:hypothetical protein n=1 Tax=Streptomyces sp. ISL-43 TaxID=2819183 RepID=UPI001BE5EF5E|nr:hypothetical protein [Streptomyces sp. ISL-43]MBT2448884.1 hypothetical protein [Streptomyces sp. ISL-43]
MITPDIAVRSAVESFDTAIAEHRIQLLEAAYQDLAVLPKATLAEHSPELGPHLAGRLGEMPQWHAAVYAVFVGALVEWNADAVACARPVLDGLRESLERAVEFAGLWQERHGDEVELPDPEGMPSPEQQKAFGPDYGDVWHAPYFGWLTVHHWEKAAVAVLADPRVRARLDGPDRLGDRDALVELTQRLEPHIGDLQCAQRALLLLDDEPLLVLDRASGRAFRMRMGGIADNYQLQTLLAGVLIGGGHLTGAAPSAEAFALSCDAPIDMDRLDALPQAVECFNFAEPSGRWIWSATTPSRIPVVDGVRRLVLDPPVFQHGYPAVRFLPRVPGRLVLEAVLEPAEAAPYFAGVRELMSWQEASRLAADAY